MITIKIYRIEYKNILFNVNGDIFIGKRYCEVGAKNINLAKKIFKKFHKNARIIKIKEIREFKRGAVYDD